MRAGADAAFFEVAFSVDLITSTSDDGLGFLVGV
jgi:hypothetical protein